MENNNKKTVIKIVLKFLSVAFAILFVVSTLGAVAIGGVRDFFQKGQFEEMVNDMDLNKVEFTSNGKTYTASEFVYEAVLNLLPSELKGYTNLINSVFGNSATNAIKQVISIDAVDKLVKESMMDCVDYYLESDAKEAKERIKNGKYVHEEGKEYENVKTPEDAVKIYIRSFIINSIENSSGVTSDEIIVMLSKDTQTKCIAVAVISAILLILCNLGSIFDLLIYFGGSSLAFGIVVTTLQNKFESAQTDKNLIGYQMLKPLVDSFTPNTIAGIVVGIILILAFVGLFIMSRAKAKPLENQ